MPHGVLDPLDTDALAAEARRMIERLAALDRESCSPGEHAAARLIAEALRERGATAWVERRPAHGTYWWPLGLTSLAGLVAAAVARRRRAWAAAAGIVAAVAVLDDLGSRRRWLRRLLPKRTTANVVAIAGDHQAERTLVLVAHHDAAHSGAFFDPRLAAVAGGRGRVGGVGELAGVMAPLPAGPALVGAGALVGSRWLVRLGAGICAGIVGSFVDIALRPAVPGANDNLTGVATVLAVARSLADRPVSGLRVMLVSTGAEEALMEGMCAFVDAHLDQLRHGSAQVLCIDSVGSAHLVVPAAEGMLRARSHDAELMSLIGECAEEAGIAARHGIVMRMGTDGYVALRHGIPTALLMSVGENGVPSNYHWPTDTPDRVDYSSCVDAIVLCDRLVRRLANDAAPASGQA